MSPEDPGQVDTLFKCVLGIKCWTANNFLQLDQDRTQVLREKLNAILEAASLNPCQQVKNLGVVVDADLSNPHQRGYKKGILPSKAHFYQFLSQANADYRDALFCGLPQKNILYVIRSPAA